MVSWELPPFLNVGPSYLYYALIFGTCQVDLCRIDENIGLEFWTDKAS